MYLPNEQGYMYRQVILLLTKSLKKRCKKSGPGKENVRAANPKVKLQFKFLFLALLLNHIIKHFYSFFVLLCDFFPACLEGCAWCGWRLKARMVATCTENLLKWCGMMSRKGWRILGYGWNEASFSKLSSSGRASKPLRGSREFVRCLDGKLWLLFMN